MNTVMMAPCRRGIARRQLCVLTIAIATVLAMLAMTRVAAHAEDWPARPVKVIAAFAPGGSADIYARILAGQLSTAFRQQFYVENRPGSSGAVGSAQVARSEPDGYTLLIGGAGPMLTGPAVNPNIGYDPLRDFTHIAMIAGDGYILAASPGSGLRSFADFVDLARRQGLTCGSPGAGSLAHLIIEQLRGGLQINLQHVPYRSGADSATALLGDHLDVSVQAFSSVGELVRSRRIAALAVTDRERAPSFPDVPSLGELGYPGIGGVAWFWLAAPAHLPAPIVAQLNAEVRRIVAAPEVGKRFEADGLLTQDLDPAALTHEIARQVALWRALARDIGLTVR